MPDSTTNSAPVSAPPTTAPPDSDDGIFERANYTGYYKASYCPDGVVTCLETDGKIDHIRVIRERSLRVPDYEAYISVKDNTLKRIERQIMGKVAWTGPWWERPSLRLFEGCSSARFPSENNGILSGATILENMMEIPNPPSEFFPPGSVGNKAYKCTIIETLDPLVPIMDPRSAWGANQPVMGDQNLSAYLLTTDNWTVVPSVDSSSAS